MTMTLNVYASAYLTAIERGETRTRADASAWRAVTAYQLNEIKRACARGPVAVSFYAVDGVIASD